MPGPSGEDSTGETAAPSLCRHSRESRNLFPVKALRDPRFRGADDLEDSEEPRHARDATHQACPPSINFCRHSCYLRLRVIIIFAIEQPNI